MLRERAVRYLRKNQISINLEDSRRHKYFLKFKWPDKCNSIELIIMGFPFCENICPSIKCISFLQLMADCIVTYSDRRKTLWRCVIVIPFIILLGLILTICWYRKTIRKIMSKFKEKE